MPSPGEASVGELCPVLGSPQQEGLGHAGGRAGEGHEDGQEEHLSCAPREV